MKFLQKTLILGFLTLFFVSCGHEENDPKPVIPVKTKLEIVKENIVGTWRFVSAQISNGEQTVVYEGGCNFSGTPNWFYVNALDSDYTFFENKNIEIFRNCHGINGTLYQGHIFYEITNLSNKLIIDISNGEKYEIVSTFEGSNFNSIKLKSLVPKNGATEVYYNFIKQQ